MVSQFVGKLFVCQLVLNEGKGGIRRVCGDGTCLVNPKLGIRASTDFVWLSASCLSYP